MLPDHGADLDQPGGAGLARRRSGRQVRVSVTGHIASTGQPATELGRGLTLPTSRKVNTATGLVELDGTAEELAIARHGEVGASVVIGVSRICDPLTACVAGGSYGDGCAIVG